ncbi:MAG: hypothetical protein H6704_12895 [Myxococcales bacterium]|nr:hypothetical protein [Myxococcales bacterium]
MSAAPLDPARLDAIFDEFEELSRELVGLQRQVAAVHADLALLPDRAGERTLDALRAERDEKLMRWATLALAWRLEGGRIVLEDPDETVHERVDGAAPQTSPVGAVPLAGGGDDSLESSPDDDEEEDELDLSILDSVVLGPSWAQGEGVGVVPFDVDAAHGIIERVGEPRAELTDDELLDEAAQVDREVMRCADWSGFPRAIQQALLGLFASRLRRLQDDTSSQLRSLLALQLKKDFAKLTQFSNEHQPGWITGLSRSHRPESGSWVGDAEFWWNALRRELGGFALDAERAALNPEVALRELAVVVGEEVPSPVRVRRAATRALNAGVQPEDVRLARLLVGHLDALSGDKALKRLRRAVRQAEASEAEASIEIVDEDEGDAALPADWPYFERTRGRVAVMVGGEVREPARARIEAAFGFESVEWISGWDIRTVQSLGERVGNGGVDFVVLLARFISHKVTDILMPPLRDGDVDWVMVRQGYGVNQLRMAIERYLGEGRATGS